MSAFLNGVSAVFVVLLLMLVGFWMGRAGWMDRHVKTFLGKYIMNIAVPLNCLTGLLNHLDRSMLSQTGVMTLAAVLSILCNFLLGMALAALLGLPRNRWGVFVAMAGVSNTLFIGLPLSTQLFGERCLPYVMSYYLGSTVFTQTAALILVERSGNSGGGGQAPLDLAKDLLKKPAVLGIVVSVALLLLDLRPPEVFMSFARYISSSVSPMALIYCGFVMYELGLKNLRLERGLPLMLVCRLAVAPLLCAGMCRLLGVGGFPRDVMVVESALPVVSQVTVMAGAYGADDRYAATGATLSTIGCFFTIPVLMVLLGG